MLTPERLDAIEAAAREATPGPWTAMWHRENDGRKIYWIGSMEEHEVTVAIVERPQITEARKTAHFIATANPATVLALVAMARRAPADVPASVLQLSREDAVRYYREQYGVTEEEAANMARISHPQYRRDVVEGEET